MCQRLGPQRVLTFILKDAESQMHSSVQIGT